MVETPSTRSTAPTLRARVLGSKVFIIVGVVMVALIAVGAFRSGVKKYQINQEVDSMNAQIASITRENERLSNFLQYLGTNSFLERQAKSQLGLRVPGETIVAVPSVGANTSTVPASTVQEQAAAQRSNPTKWWDYFFAS